MFAGGISGIVAGFVTPPYLGWQIGGYVGKQLELGWFMESSLNVLAAVSTIPAWSVSVRVEMILGGVVGSVAGGLTGVLYGAGKKGLEGFFPKGNRTGIIDPAVHSDESSRGSSGDIS